MFTSMTCWDLSYHPVINIEYTQLDNEKSKRLMQNIAFSTVKLFILNALRLFPREKCLASMNF